MNKKDLILFLILDALAILTVLVGFRFAPSYVFAITLANLTFISLGAFVLRRVWSWSEPKKSLTFWWVHIQFIVGVLPLSVSRALHFQATSLPSVMGVPSGTYHRLSEVLFTVYVLATIIDLFRMRRGSRPS